MPQSVPSLPRRAARVLRTSLFAQVACALVIGVVVGTVWAPPGPARPPRGGGVGRHNKAKIAPPVVFVVGAGK
ncbi:C4-dicarboxylate transporter DctA, partial [Streptomyces sp. NPDC056728]